VDRLPGGQFDPLGLDVALGHLLHLRDVELLEQVEAQAHRGDRQHRDVGPGEGIRPQGEQRQPGREHGLDLRRVLLGQRRIGSSGRFEQGLEVAGREVDPRPAVRQGHGDALVGDLDAPGRGHARARRRGGLGWRRGRGLGRRLGRRLGGDGRGWCRLARRDGGSRAGRRRGAAARHERGGDEQRGEQAAQADGGHEGPHSE
jgi:hypothetical protein